MSSTHAHRHRAPRRVCVAWLGLLLPAVSPAHGQAILDRTVIAGARGERMDSLLRHLADSSFAGTVLVVARGRTLLLKGYGYANIATRTPNDARTLFDFGSITKTLTGAAALVLDARGALSVDEPLSTFLGPVDSAKARATIDHLAKHVSGFVIAGTDISDSTRRGFMEKMRAAPAESPPGATYRYSNAGASLIAAIVEQRSGMPFGDFVRQAIFEPAGIAAGFRWESEWDARRARGYGGAAGSPPRELPAPAVGWGIRGATGWIGTVGDVYRFNEALRRGKILPPAQLARTADSTTVEAYGWHDQPTNKFGAPVIHKGGDFPGFQSQILYFPQQDVTIVWANNDQRLRWRDRLNDGLAHIALSHTP